jgi:hypothetical protein
VSFCTQHCWRAYLEVVRKLLEWFHMFAHDSYA